MNKCLNIKYAAIMRAFLLVMAVGLSNNALTAKPDLVTQAELDAAIAAQQAALKKAQDDIDALKALVESYHGISPKFKVGDRFGGGIIFYVDNSGEHGLIASLSDLDDGNGIQWYNGINKVTGATGDGIGAGASNTTVIVTAQADDTPGGNFAAKLAADYSVQEDGVTACTGSIDEICYGDWYLPSAWELLKLYQNRDYVGGFAQRNYWSSTEGDADTAFQVIFDDSVLQYSNASKYYPLRVRAIRVF